jgi:hypothetical protein
MGEGPQVYAMGFYVTAFCAAHEIVHQHSGLLIISFFSVVQEIATSMHVLQVQQYSKP